LRILAIDPTLGFAEKHQHSGIAEVDKDKNPPTLFKYGLDTQRRPFWYDGRVVIDRNEVRG